MHTLVSKGGIPVNDINHAPTQCVVEASDVLLCKCLGDLESWTQITAHVNQTKSVF